MRPVFCPTGIGTRVAAMANALSRANEVWFPWVRNVHCPLGVDEVFPHGVDGVDFSPSKMPMMPTTWNGLPANHWDAAGDREKANAAYGRIMGTMAGEAVDDPPSVAMLARFRGRGREDWERFAGMVAVGQHAGERVFVLTDRFRDECAESLRSAGLAPVLPQCSELWTDLDRQADDALLFLGDWKTMIAAEEVFYLGHSTLIHPAIARGVSTFAV